MAQAASCRLITGARVRCQVSPFVIYGEQSGAGTSFSLSTKASPCHCFSTSAQYLYCIHLLLTLYILRGRPGAWETDLVYFIINGNIN